MDETIIDLAKPPTGSIQEPSFYVCFSRLTHLKNLLILRPWYSDNEDVDKSLDATWYHVRKYLTSPRSKDFLDVVARLEKMDEATMKIYRTFI